MFATGQGWHSRVFCVQVSHTLVSQQHAQILGVFNAVFLGIFIVITCTAREQFLIHNFYQKEEKPLHGAYLSQIAGWSLAILTIAISVPALLALSGIPAVANLL